MLIYWKKVGNIQVIHMLFMFFFKALIPAVPYLEKHSQNSIIQVSEVADCAVHHREDPWRHRLYIFTFTLTHNLNHHKLLFILKQIRCHHYCWANTDGACESFCWMSGTPQKSLQNTSRPITHSDRNLLIKSVQAVTIKAATSMFNRFALLKIHQPLAVPEQI